VWKLKEEKICEEYQSMVKDKVAEAEWKYLDVNEHWQHVDSQKVQAVIRKHGCGMRKLLKQ